ncbi:MAG: beta-lactamase family protein [Caulobacteraceae bacterium]|nr:beta-lactamase family protein [Caulobacter sp.]
MTTEPSRRRLFAGGAAALLAAPAARAGIPVPLPFGGKKPPLVDVWDVVRATGAPAAGGVVVTAKAEPFLGVAGRRRANLPQEVTPADLWDIGSNTKALTAALYARYVEAGKASWSAKLPALLPDLKLDPAWADTSIYDVMAHRAGLSDVGVIEADFLAGAAADPRPATEQRTALVAQVLAQPPRRPPGGFEYSNLDYVIAGAAIERIAKSSWEDAMRAQVFAPLGMAHAGFGAPTGEEPWGHRLGDDRRLHPVSPADLADYPVVLAPSGGVHLSLADYARFARVFLVDGGGFLQPDSLHRLARPWGGQSGDYGLGWQVTEGEGWAQGPLLSHEGSNGLWHAQVQLAPARGVAVISCANAETGGGIEAARRLSLKLVQAYAA